MTAKMNMIFIQPIHALPMNKYEQIQYVPTSNFINMENTQKSIYVINVWFFFVSNQNDIKLEN